MSTDPANDDRATEELLEGFEERADHITEDLLRESTVKKDYFGAVHQALIDRGLVLVQGPRGSGKTHLMRYTWLQCRERRELPLAIYVSFNRYLRLEPLLLGRADALTLFQTWALCRILQAADTLAGQLAGPPFNILQIFLVERGTVEHLISCLERGIELSEEDDAVLQRLSIERVADAIEIMADHYARKRAVLLLDDAALTLTPEYLVEFFDIVRVLKRSRLSPKASIYPGTTEFGPRFHASHEGKIVTAWLPVENRQYCEVMSQIGETRIPDSKNAPADVKHLLMYAAFGVPRAYLAMLREWHLDGFSREQQGLNRIIQAHNEGRQLEYRSLALKVPRLATLVATGVIFFQRMIEAIREANEELIAKGEKQLLIGVEASGIEPLVDRMISLLIEAGLIYEHVQVAHGADRSYRRFTPHLSALIATRAFTGRSKGTSASQTVEFLNRPPTKHPVRRTVGTLLGKEIVSQLKLDLSPCQVCHSPRLKENQKFCHVCGNKLIDESIYTRCMRLELSDVPSLTTWARQKLYERNIQTIGDLLALKDPGTELRKIYMVGPARAEKIMMAVQSYVDEFLS